MVLMDGVHDNFDAIVLFSGEDLVTFHGLVKRKSMGDDIIHPGTVPSRYISIIHPGSFELKPVCT